jgi:hypothetical protein
MKILHTSDWHLGKFVNGFSMLEDQKYILNELILSLKKNKIDSVKKIIKNKSYKKDFYIKKQIKLSEKVIVKVKINENEKIEKIISFPNNGMFSYSAYGGLCTRININYINSTPSIDFSNDWEPEVLLQQIN